MEIVATTSFASSRPPERRPLERRTLAPIMHQTDHQLFMHHSITKFPTKAGSKPLKITEKSDREQLTTDHKDNHIYTNR